MSQKQFLTAIDLEEAQKKFWQAIQPVPLGSECVAIGGAVGRILAVDVVARTNVPFFDRSNFDGFAVRSADVAGSSENEPIHLELADGQIPAGIEPEQALDQGQAIAISTGGMVPRGADAICLLEHTGVLDQGGRKKLKVSHPVHAGSGISFTGTDIAMGEVVLRSGQPLSSRETGVLAAIGEADVEVFARPRVAVISTGNEIIPPGSEIRPGLVFDSNARMIADAVRELGAIPLEMGIAVDDLSTLEQKVAEAIAEADVILLSGGTSKGEGDLSYQVVSRLRDPGIIAHGVALKPGKPICLAATAGKPLVVLPGFPTSAIFTFHEFVAPVIRRLAGAFHEQALSRCEAELASRVNSEIGRTEFLLVGLMEKRDEDDPTAVDSSSAVPLLRAYPMGKGSGSVTTFSRADGFITIDRHTEILEKGTPVQVQKIGLETAPADLVVMGSHCAGLDRLLQLCQKQGVRVKLFSIGSLGGLQAVRRGDCDLAGVHLFDPQTNSYNRAFADRHVEIVDGYRRRQGVVYRKDDPRLQAFVRLSPINAITSICAHPGMMMINRNQGSGTRVLMDRLLTDSGFDGRPNGYEIQPSNHHAVCSAIGQHRADWGLAIEAVAEQHGLGFLPVEWEHFDFAIPRSRLELEPVQIFLSILRAPETGSLLEEIGLQTKSVDPVNGG